MWRLDSAKDLLTVNLCRHVSSRRKWHLTNGCTPSRDWYAVLKWYDHPSRPGDPNTFLVFAELVGADFGVSDRTDATIWYSEEDDLKQTDLSLIEFVSACLREVDELQDVMTLPSTGLVRLLRLSSTETRARQTKNPCTAGMVRMVLPMEREGS